MLYAVVITEPNGEELNFWDDLSARDAEKKVDQLHREALETGATWSVQAYEDNGYGEAIDF